MKNRSPRLRTLAFLSASSIAVLVAAPTVLAESACKGLEQGSCEGKSDCTWVDGYTRKDGINVAGHCKAIGKRSGSAASKEKESEKVTKTAATKDSEPGTKPSKEKDGGKEKKSTAESAE